MNEFWLGYTTPHIRWAKPYVRGKVKAFFIAPYTAAREVTELAQRLDLEVSGETTAHSTALGATDIYNAQVQGTSPAEKRRALARKLKDRYDVIVVANFNFDLLPPEVQFRIAEQVVEGAGLVLVYRHKARPEFFRHPDEEGRRFITTGIPFEGLRFYRDYVVKQAKLTSVQEAPDKVVGAYRLKQGRVVQLDFLARSQAVYGGFCLTPPETFDFQSQAQYEYHQMLMINALLWAAKREPPIRLGAPQILQSAEEISLPAQTILPLESESAGVVTLEFKARNLWGEVEWSHEKKVSLRKGTNSISISLPALGGGEYYLDLRVVGSRGVMGWAAHFMKVASPVRIQQVAMDKVSFEKTEKASGVVTLQKEAPFDCLAQVNLLDNYQRVYARADFPIKAGEKEIRFSIPLRGAVSMAGRCRVKLLTEGRLLDEDEAEFFIPRRDQEQFLTLLWGTYPGIVGHFLDDQIREAGFNAVLFRPADVEVGESRTCASVARDDLFTIPYATHITHWNDSFGDDSVYEKAKEYYQKLAQSLAPYGPPIYSLGDENSILEDIGFHPKDKPGFIAYLRRAYSDLESLNKAWGTRLKDWEDAVPIRLPEARKENRLAQYHDTESYREELYARWHHYMHDIFKEVDPHARVGSEGSTPGDLEKTIAGLEFWGPYREPVYVTLLRSLAPRSLMRGNWFGGYVSQRRDLGSLRRFVWDSFLDGSNLFEIFCSYTCETIFNNDFTFGYWTMTYLPDLQQIVDGIGQFQNLSEHDNDPVAIYHSQASLHAAEVAAPFAEWRQDHLAALTLINDAGYQPYYLTSRQVEAGALQKPDKPRLLFMPYIQSLSRTEAEAIANFVEDGGVVIADVATGVLDEHCAPRPQGAIDSLLGIKRHKAPNPVKARIELSTGASPFGNIEVLADAAAIPEAGRALGKVGEGAAFIIHHHGAGATALWNFPFTAYLAAGRENREAIIKSLRTLFPLPNIQPPCQLRTRDDRLLPEARISRFRRGDLRSVGLLAPRTTPEAKAMETVLTLHPAYVYDQRTGKRYGYTSKISLTLDPTSATMLSLLPYEVQDIKVTAPAKVKRGEAANLVIKLKASRPARGHVLRVLVFDPSGKKLSYLSRTLTADEGTATCEIPFAFNDPIGTWTVTIRDIATRLEKNIKLKVD